MASRLLMSRLATALLGFVRTIRRRLSEERLASAFRPGDAELRGAAAAALARWEADGTLARPIETWLPYRSRIE